MLFRRGSSGDHELIGLPIGGGERRTSYDFDRNCTVLIDSIICLLLMSFIKARTRNESKDAYVMDSFGQTNYYLTIFFRIENELSPLYLSRSSSFPKYKVLYFRGI